MQQNIVELFYTPLLSTKERFSERLLELVSRERRNAGGKSETRKLSVYANVLLREAICGELGVSNRELSFSTGEYGKPYLKQPLLDGERLHFSVSHTETALVVALSKAEIGVDIEKIEAFDPRIADRCFSVDEKDFIACSSDPRSDFYRVWTRKEAYLKQNGRGLTLPLNSFSVFKEEERFRTYLRDGYLISLCCEREDKVYLIEMDESELERSHLIPLR